MRFSLLLLIISFLVSSFATAKIPSSCSKEDKIESGFEQSLIDLKQKASETLKYNIVKLDSGYYVRAGATHFGSLWTRDFVYTVPGLLTLGLEGEKAARDHLGRLLDDVRGDGLVPRLYDSVGKNGRSGSVRRIAAYVLDGRSPFSEGLIRFFQRIPFVPFEVEFDFKNDPKAFEKRENALRLTDTAEQPLVAEYLGEHATPAFDSNILTILGALQYVDKTGDLDWFHKHRKNIFRAYKFYDDKFSKKGLIKQPKFSDWQDSVARKGHTFYVNFLYWKVGTELLKHKRSYDGMLDEFPVDVERLADVKFKLWEKFFIKKKGLFRTHRSHWMRNHYGLEDQLFSIQYPEFYRGVTVALSSEHILSGEELRRHHFESLKKSALWKGSSYSHYDFNVPGLATEGAYFFWDRSFNTNFGGIRRYHDKFIWSWLVGESSKVAAIMDGAASGRKILEDFVNTGIKNSPYIGEIYTIACDTVAEAKTGIFGIKPKGDRFFYRSENPFSWGSAKILEGITVIESLK